MKKFNLTEQVTISVYTEVEANTLEEAISIAEERTIEAYRFGDDTQSEEAFYKYKEAKELYIKEVADKWKNQIPEKVHNALYNYVVEITD